MKKIVKGFVGVVLLLAAASVANADSPDESPTVCATFVVAKTGASDDNPGTAEKPLASIEKAVEKAKASLTAGESDLAVVSVGVGDFTVADTVVVDAAIRIVGAGAERTSVVHANTKRIFCLNHADASLAQLTLADGRGANNTDRPGGCVKIDANGGTVEWCHVLNGSYCDNFQTGAGIGMVGPGLVSHCVISNCNNNFTGNGLASMYGGGIYASAGTIDNCLIVDCGARGDGGGIYAAGSTVKVRNCTIVGNKTHSTGGGLYCGSAPAEVVNCVFANNEAKNDTGAYKPNVAPATVSASKFKNCAFVGGTVLGSDAVSMFDTFVDSACADWRLLFASPAVNAGLDDEALAAVDLDGRTRVVGGKVDIGCYETVPPDFGCSVVPEKVVAFNDEELSFGVELVGATVDEVAAAWEFVLDGQTMATTFGIPGKVTLIDPGVYTIVLTVTKKTGGATATETRKNLVTIAPRTVNVAPGESLQAAYDLCVDGSEIVLADGDYPLSAQLTVEKGVTIRGSGWTNCTILAESNKKIRLVKLNHANAVLTGVTVKGGYGAGNTDRPGSNIQIGANGGTVSWCRVTEGGIYDNFQKGGGIGMVGAGLVSHCIVDNNDMRKDNMADVCGGGIYAENGTVDNCLVAGNIARHYGGGIYVAGTTVKIRNCTIVGNTAQLNAGGGLYCASTPAEVVNCVFAGNAAANDTGTYKPHVGPSSVSTAKFKNCAFVGGTALGSDAVPMLDTFVDSANGDWRLLYTSDAVDAGLDDGALAAVDLDNHARVTAVKSERVDIGCYETLPPDFACSILVNWDKAFNDEEVEFDADLLGATADEADASWEFYLGDTLKKTATGIPCKTTLTEAGVYTVVLEVTKKGGGEKTSQTRVNLVTIAPRTISVAPGESLQAAYDLCVDGSEIVLADGEHRLSAQLTVEKEITIRGNGWEKCTILPEADKRFRLVRLNHAKAVLTGVTVCGGCGGGNQDRLGSNIQIGVNGGTVSWCRITGGRYIPADNFQKGGGIALVGAGLVTHCVIDGNDLFFGQNNSGLEAYGGGVYAEAGTIDNCLVMTNRTQYCGGGVYVAGTTVKIRNCTIVGNAAQRSEGGGLYCAATPAEVVNCVFAGNAAANDTGTYKPHVGPSSVSTAKFKNCAFVGGTALGSDAVSMLDTFVDSANGDWRLLYTSAAVDAGLDDGALAEVDLDNHARVTAVKSERVDIGCYETARPDFACSILASTDKAFDDEEVTLDADIVGATADEVDVTWKLYLGETLKQTATGVRYATVLSEPGAYTVVLEVTKKAGGATTSQTRANLITIAPRTIAVAPGESLQAAYDLCMDGSEIVLGDGEHSLAAQFTVEKGVTIRGNGWEKCAILPVDGKKIRLVKLNHANAVLTGVTVRGGYGAGNTDRPGSNIQIGSAGGTVSWCRVTDGHYGDNFQKGGGIGMVGPGRISHCLIDNNDMCDRSLVEIYGGGVYATAGTIDNCLVVSNRAMHAGGGLYLSGDSIKVVNCTVADNECRDCAGGIYTGGKVTVANCLFARNTDGGTSSYTGAPVWYRSGTPTYSHCLWDAATPRLGLAGDDSIYADPLLRGHGRDPYRLTKGSRGIDEGSDDAYGPELLTDVDLRGVLRRRGERVDIGCYEAVFYGLLLLVQ